MEQRKEYSEFMIKVKSGLDNATFKAVGDTKKTAFSDIEETETGFIYKVDFEKQPK